MTWIDLKSVTDEHAAYLSCIGRALSVAQHFEGTCRHILSLCEVDNSSVDASLDAVSTLFDSMRKRQLGQIVWRLRFPSFNFSDDEIGLLEKGREARNYVAHESATTVSEYIESKEELFDRISVFNGHLKNLIAADNEVSAWAYEALESQIRPVEHYCQFPERAFSWVTGPLLEIGLSVDSADVNESHAEQ